MKSYRSIFAALSLAVTLLATSLSAPSSTATNAQGTNLLYNGGFEGRYTQVGIYENMRVASGWVAWWHEGALKDILEGYRMRPEFKAAFSDDAPFDRTHSGTQAQQYFHSFANFEGGVLQNVTGVRVGQRLHFSIWGMAWSCDRYERCHENNPPRVWSWRPSNMHMRIGIDPFGGTDPDSKNVVWSEEKNSYDVWAEWTVEAVAASTSVTVFTYSYPEYRSADNDVYFDDASLTVVGTGSVPTNQGGGTTTTPPVAPTAVPAPSTGSTPVPPRTGETNYTVASGDTLSAIGLRFGVSWRAIADRNSLANPDYVYVGQVLVIPAR